MACTEWYRTQSVKTIHEFGNSDFLTLSSYFLRMDQLSVDGASSITEKKKKNYENLCPAVAMVLYFSSCKELIKLPGLISVLKKDLPPDSSNLTFFWPFLFMYSMDPVMWKT